MSVQQVATKEEFDSIKKGTSKLIVVDFFATWCGPCKIIAPKFAALAKEFADEIVALKVDVDEVEDVAAEVGVSAMPTFMFFKGDKKIGEVVGSNEDKLREMIETNK